MSSRAFGVSAESEDSPGDDNPYREVLFAAVGELLIANDCQPKQKSNNQIGKTKIFHDVYNFHLTPSSFFLSEDCAYVRVKRINQKIPATNK